MPPKHLEGMQAESFTVGWEVCDVIGRVEAYKRMIESGQITAFYSLN